MEKTNIRYYIEGYLNDTLTESERQFFFENVMTEENKEAFQGVVTSMLEDSPKLDAFDEKLWPLFREVVQVDKSVPEMQTESRSLLPRVRTMHGWWRAAAVVLLLAVCVMVVVFVMNDRPATPASPVSVAAGPRDIAPGRNGAILTLADGRQVVLDSLGNGVVASQQGAEVVLKNGQLAYERTGNATAEIVYNTMSTPKGRQFHMTMTDGSRVWLNAASAIRYPTVFTGQERLVEVEGEVYFEVAKNNAMPFRVKVNDRVTIEVLGTHFNVNAYENENTLNTTLLEGSVRVKVDAANAVLKPGQQARIAASTAKRLPATEKPDGNASISVVNDVDLDKVMAWKNGLFNFDGANLQEVMRQLERWYDIDVVYEKGVPDIEFVGKMTKDVPLSGLLSMLEKSDVRFKVEGRKLMVLP